MKWTKSLLAATLSLTLTACAEIDCPLQNIVALRVGFYGADGAQIQLPDTLSILAAGTDSVLFNRGIAITSVDIPVSYTREADTLLLHMADAAGRVATDSLIFGHTNQVHFENIDCPPAVFHSITSVRWTSHDPSVLPMTVDSVVVASPNINYDAQENLKVYIRTR